MENMSIAPNGGRDNKILVPSLDRVPSDYVIMGMPVVADKPWEGYTALNLIKREDVTKWQEMYGGLSYVQADFDDYSEFVPWTRSL